MSWHRRQTEILLEEWQQWVQRASLAQTPEEIRVSLEECRHAYKAWEAALQRRCQYERSQLESLQTPRPNTPPELSA